MHIEIARDFFAAHFDKQLLKRIDLNRLRLESSTFIDEVHKELRSDILYSATIDNQDGYIYLTVEHQSCSEKLMAFRILQYATRIWQMHLDRQEKVPDLLPTILPLVIYNGKISPYPYSTQLRECFSDPFLVQEFLLEQFKLVDLTIIADEELASHRRAALMELLEKHIRAKNILPIIEFISNADVWGEIKHLGNGKYLRFALKYVADKGETNAIDDVFRLIADKIPEKEDEIMTIAEGLRQQGMQQGIKLGAHQKQLEIAHNLLNMGMSQETIAKITQLSIDEIEILP